MRARMTGRRGLRVELLAAQFVALSCLGCPAPEPIELVPVRGCGLDQAFSGLRVRVLGDFAPSTDTELFLAPGERGELESLREDATALAVEGVFGTTVTAVGRSYGSDPELARGRVPGKPSDSFVLPIWFAAPDSICPVDAGDEVTLVEAIAAENGAGRVVLIGGRRAGELEPGLVELDLFSSQVRSLVGAPALARVGHAVAVRADDRFVVLGGAAAGELVEEVVLVRVAGQAEVEATSLELARARAAVAQRGERVLIAGGCTSVDELGACLGSPSGEAAWLELDALAFMQLPTLVQPRIAAHAHVSADGVAYVAGGVDADGTALTSVERLRAGASSWDELTGFEVEAIAGLTVLDEGMVIVAGIDGALHWWSEAGGGVFDTSLRAPALGPALGDRELLTLPGERVLVDTWLFAPGSAATDPSREIIDLVGNTSAEVGARRTGAQPLLLGDGSVLLLGGTAIEEGELRFMARVRPQLDGPDERVPDLAAPDNDAFVSNTPGAATVVVGGLRLSGVAGSPSELPRVRAHVRGFRSRSFRLEFELPAEGSGTGWLLIGQGAATTLAIALDPPDHASVRVLYQVAGASPIELPCAQAAFDPARGGVLEVDGSGRQVRVFQGDRTLVDCDLAALEPWPDDGGLFAGFGVSGAGDRTFRALRLARR